MTSQDKRRRPRLKDVAERAGVSEATVSVVLNGRVGESVRVSQETQQKIWAAVRELGYVANPVARSLAGGRNRIIAVFTFESVFPVRPQDFYYPFFMGIEAMAEQHGYHLLLVTGTRDENNRRHIYNSGINELKIADGAILLGLDDRSEVLALIEEEYPFVFVGRRESPNDAISYVAADYADATKQLVEHLFAHQHQKIAYLCLEELAQYEARQDRQAGYHAAFEQRELPAGVAHVWCGELSELDAQLIAHLIDEGYTAFVCEDDQVGSRLLHTANEMGLRVPADFSMVVLGDPLDFTEKPPNWTSFHIPRRAMGREAVSLLLLMLDADEDYHASPYRTMLSCEFVSGTTVGPTPAR